MFKERDRERAYLSDKIVCILSLISPQDMFLKLFCLGKSNLLEFLFWWQNASWIRKHRTRDNTIKRCFHQKKKYCNIQIQIYHIKNRVNRLGSGFMKELHILTFKVSFFSGKVEFLYSGCFGSFSMKRLERSKCDVSNFIWCILWHCLTRITFQQLHMVTVTSMFGTCVSLIHFSNKSTPLSAYVMYLLYRMNACSVLPSSA